MNTNIFQAWIKSGIASMRSSMDKIKYEKAKLYS